MSPQEAQNRINEINRLQNELEDRFQELQREKVALGRIVRGDNLHDDVTAAEQQKAWAKLQAAQTNTDAIANFQENARLEAIEAREAEQKRVAEQKRRQQQRLMDLDSTFGIRR